MEQPYPVLDHLIALTDDTGLVQHATHDVPNRATGYCTDDIARALMVALASVLQSPTESGTRLVTTYLSFLHDAQLSDGWFHNFMGYDRAWQDRRGSPDSFGRAVWSLGYCLRFAPRESWRKIAHRLLDRARPHIDTLVDLRPRAYATLGLVHELAAISTVAAASKTALTAGAQAVLDAFERNVRRDWTWCEPVMTYDNARLPEALLQAGAALNNQRFIETGLRMFEFYTRIVMEDGIFVPVGNDGWFRCGGERARFGQQPIEAAATIDAALVAHSLDPHGGHDLTARAAYNWFFGANTAAAVLVANGGCADGIEAGGPNANMGAESTLAYLHSAQAMGRPSSAPLQAVR